MKWCIATALLISATARPALSQASERKILDQLESPDYGDRAWGAYRAGEEGLAQFIPKIVPLLSLSDPRLQAVAFDALIRLRADIPKLPPIEIMEARQLDPLLILLSLHPERHTGLLMRLLDRPLTGTQWTAVNSLLCAAPPPGFAGRLLGQWKMTFTVTVQGKAPHTERFHRDGAIVLGPVRGPAFVGFPPIFSYAIHRFIESGDNVLVKEPVPVYFGRGQTYIFDNSDVDRATVSFDYLRYLAGVAKDDPGVQLPSDPKFEWVDDEKYRSDTAVLLEAIRKPVSVILQRLRDRGLLTAAETRLGPRIEVTVYDARDTHLTALPKVDWRLRR
jgi:hypothetical protein